MVLEKILIENGAPTLANLKTASLFTLPVEDDRETQQVLKKWERDLGQKGISIEILRASPQSLLVYVYRKKRLQRDLEHPRAQCILCSQRYRHHSSQEALDILKMRISTQDGFPHEIGLFLGYPPEDVQGFIQNRGQNCKCCGCWKVYGDPESATRQFARFKKCREVYLRMFNGGRSLHQLTVAS